MNSVDPEAYTVKIIELIGEYLWDRGVTRGNPSDNSGAEYENDVFYIGAYDWTDSREDYLPNFWYKKKNYQVEWYKHIGRGTYANRPLTFSDAYEMLKECIDSVDTSTVIPPAEDFYWESQEDYGEE